MDLAQDVAAIKEQNARVEADKAWEISWTRRLVIACMTYVIALIWLFVIDNTAPFLNAFIPSLGYVLSTLSLPAVKRWWIRSRTRS